MSDEELKALIDKCLDIYEVACWNGIDKIVLEEKETAASPEANHEAANLRNFCS